MAAGDGPAWLHVTALGLYEVYLNGVRVGDQELAPGYTQCARRVPYQTYEDRRLVNFDVHKTSFECSDERLNQLHGAVVWSLRDNVCAIPTDCPHPRLSTAWPPLQ